MKEGVGLFFIIGKYMAKIPILHFMYVLQNSSHVAAAVPAAACARRLYSLYLILARMADNEDDLCRHPQ